MSKHTTLASLVVILSAGLHFAVVAPAQIVINELVEDERAADSSDISPDTREFIELYNAGEAVVDIGGWTVSHFLLASGAVSVSDTIPAGSMINPGGYFVIGGAAVPNVNFTPAAGELWENLNGIFELRMPDNTLVDALGVDTFRGTELAMATQEQLDQIKAGEVAGEDAKGGWWGQLISTNAIPPNTTTSLARYLDGRDRNINGVDFGILPATPGASNNLPQNQKHTIPDVDELAVGAALGTDYYASFLLPRVVDPMTADGVNPTAILPSPQGGNAIVAWDESGGGNAIYSRELVNEFALAAYIDPTPLGTTATTTQSEATIYGIGTTDPFFGTPDSAGLLGFGSSSNGSTGIGWLIQRVQDVLNATDTTVLQLIDFADGGDGVPDDMDWIVIESIDLSGTDPDWHNLGIDYDPTTGEVVAMHNNNTYNFTTATDLVGNFYVGYRENLPGAGGTFARPPTFDLILEDGESVPGDYDGNGNVGPEDYTAWVNAFGTSVDPGTGADGNGDGIVNAADYVFWRNISEAAGSGSSAAVPEPGTLALVCAMVLLAAGVRKRPA